MSNLATSLNMDSRGVSLESLYNNTICTQTLIECPSLERFSGASHDSREDSILQPVIVQQISGIFRMMSISLPFSRLNDPFFQNLLGAYRAGLLDLALIQIAACSRVPTTRYSLTCGRICNDAHRKLLTECDYRGTATHPPFGPGDDQVPVVMQGRL